jgi:hypothetical protein
MERFAALHAVAILLPYARQYLTNLTVNTLAGAYYLPAVNTVELMKGFDPSKTTAASQRVDGGDGHRVGSSTAERKADRKETSRRAKKG